MVVAVGGNAWRHVSATHGVTGWFKADFSWGLADQGLKICLQANELIKSLGKWELCKECRMKA